MMPPSVIYALTNDEDREALNRAEARRRLVHLLTQEPVRGQRPARRVERRARLRLTRLLRYRATPRPETGGATCRP